MAKAVTRFGLNRAEVGQLFSPGGRVYIATGRFADRVLIRARVLAPERSGKLRRSLHKFPRYTPLGVNWLVGSDLDYTEAVHEGTKAHVIRPVNGKGLAFEGLGGRKVFVKVAHHPGSKGTPFLRRALIEEQARGL